MEQISWSLGMRPFADRLALEFDQNPGAHPLPPGSRLRCLKGLII